MLDGSVRVEGRDLGAFVRSSASIRRGFSGGPLADARRRLIGITVGSTLPDADGRRTAVATPRSGRPRLFAAL